MPGSPRWLASEVETDGATRRTQGGHQAALSGLPCRDIRQLTRRGKWEGVGQTLQKSKEPCRESVCAEAAWAG